MIQRLPLAGFYAAPARRPRAVPWPIIPAPFSTRAQFRTFMAQQAAAVVVFEACGSASYWAREMAALGHEVRLIAPQYVRPFVKRQKNDAADAEAIVVAAQRPEMRFVAPKTADQQARAVAVSCPGTPGAPAY